MCSLLGTIILFVISWGLCCPVSAEDAELMDSRIWRGKNGKHFRGKFIGRDGDILRVQGSRGKIYRVPTTSLSDADRKWFQKAWVNQQQKENAIEGLAKAGEVEILKDLKLPAVAPIGYRRVPDEKITRRNLPLFDQSEYYDKNHTDFSSSMVPFILWWHNYRVVNVPSRRDDNERRIKWLYQNFNKCTIQSRYVDGRKLQKFFQKELKTTACFQVLDLRDGAAVYQAHKTLDRFSPEFLSKYTVGANATILCVPIYKGSRYQWTAELPLVECEESGEAVMYMYGLKLRGKIEKLPPGKRNDRLPRYEVKITNMGDLPDWFQARDYSFRLEGKDGVGLVVVIPNVAEMSKEEK